MPGGRPRVYVAQADLDRVFGRSVFIPAVHLDDEVEQPKPLPAEARANKRRDKNEAGHVYFAETECGTYIKIGFSTQVRIRITTLGTLRPGNFQLRLIGTMPGSEATERWLHGKFVAYRDNGEWFRSTSELRNFIAVLGLLPPEDSL